MIDIFNQNVRLDLTNITCMSGGASGSDSAWESIGEEYGVKTKAYSYKTKYHTSPNKVEISEEDYKEGIISVNIANKTINRYGIHKYMNLLARNWSQIKYSSQTIAIGVIIKVGQKNAKGYYNRGKYDLVDGGTCWAVQMSIDNNKPVYVFDQIEDKWFRWSFSALRYVLLSDTPTITEQNFAGIGSRELQPNGLKAIRDVYVKTFKK